MRTPACDQACARGGVLRRSYLKLVGWAFALFNGVRVFAYLPTLWAIQRSADSAQHSAWTWFTFFGANLSMAAWLYEAQGQRLNRAVAVNLGNAAMCLAIWATVLAYRH